MQQKLTVLKNASYGLSPRGPRPRFFLIGNRLAVDFANTLRTADVAGDGLASWSDLMEFLAQAGILSKERVEPLRALTTAAPEAATEALRAALDLRAAIRSALEALTAGQAVPADAVAPVNAVLRWTEGYDQLVPAGEGWRLGFVERSQRLEWLLAAIARSAAELIAEGPGAPVHTCASPTCMLYFYDTSRTGRRRWCSMAVCGNRNKVAAHARRTAARARRKK